jgi:hypothetical protein
MIYWVLHLLGVEPRQPSTAYNWWSGAGSDLGEITLLVALVGFFNCHETGCFRVGRLTTVEENGHHYRRCRRHHLLRHEDGPGT